MAALTDEDFRCRVCGLKHESPPWGEDGRTALFELCACCGVEWGYQDCLPKAVRSYRERWPNDGSDWHRPELRPANWDLDEQPTRIPAKFK